jgi:AcrR family transcriptional regulator
MKKVGVRERIIETASDLFYNQGYNQTGINQIIDEAGVAKASMYMHFRSKEDIAVAYLVSRHVMWIQNLEESVSNIKDAKNRVVGVFDYLMKWLTEVNFRGCGWQNIITDLPVNQNKIIDQARFHKTELRYWVQKQLMLGNEYKNKDAQDISVEVMVLIEGAIILSQIQKDSFPILTAKKVCERILI